MAKCVEAVVQCVLSPKVSLLALIAALVVTVVGLWAERDSWLPYYKQEYVWSRPVLVISSDDWGGTSPPETVEDLDALANALTGITDPYGHPPVVTVYMCPAGPDFSKIEQASYSDYFYRWCYWDKPQLTAKWRELCKRGVFDIQFHGREHSNVPLWMALVREDVPGYQDACKRGLISPYKEPAATDPRLVLLGRSFIDASSYPPRALSVEVQKDMITSGLRLLEKHLEVRAEIFVAPGHVYDTNTLTALAGSGVQFLEARPQSIILAGPNLELSRSDRKWSYGPAVNGIRGIVRQPGFEPFRGEDYGATDLEKCMWGIKRGLATRMPVVLSSHRWNYVQATAPDSRRYALLLRELIMMIQTEAPTVAFLSAADLAKYTYNEGNGAQRDISLTVETLSGIDKVWHCFRCLWSVHRAFRLVACSLLAAVLWVGLTTARLFIVARRGKATRGNRRCSTD